MVRRRSLLTLLLSLAVALAALPPPPGHVASAGARGLATQLDTYLAGLTARHWFSGSVLVARQGTVLLSKGYGMADRQRRRPITPGTPFGVSGFQGSVSILSPLWLEDHGMLSDRAPICRYLPQCPASWRPITLHMALDGTSGLPGFGTDTPGQTTAESLRIMQGEPLDHAPGASVGYQNGEVLVLSLIAERVSGQPYGTFIRRAFLNPAGMAHSGRVTTATAPPDLAESYSGQAHNANAVADSSSFFAAYATAPDVYAYDNALFGGTLVSRRSLSRLFGPRALVPDPPTGFSQVRYGYWWRIGQVAGHQVVFTVRGTAANLRFPRDGVTIVVLGNDDQNDAGAIAADLAALVFGRHVAPPPPIQTHAPVALVGTYRRTFQDADRIAARDPGLKDWVGGAITITIGTGSIHFALLDGKPEDSVDEYYTATEDGRLTLGRYAPANHNSFCSDNPHSVPPTGTYRWARRGSALIITRSAFDPCLDRGATLPGSWTKVG